MSRLMSV